MLWYCISNITMTVIFWYFTDKVIWMFTKFYDRNYLVEHLSNLTEMKEIKHLS
jgi:hypothetical protein